MSVHAPASRYPYAPSLEFMRYLDPASPDERRIYSPGSFYGNPLVAAAAVANLNSSVCRGDAELALLLGAAEEGLKILKRAGAL